MAYEPVTAAELRKHKSARPGVTTFMKVVLSHYGPRRVANDGIYNRRKQRGGSGWSLHATGRAADVGLHNLDTGNDLVIRVIRAAGALGVCEVIWNHHRWTAEKGYQGYHGSDPHVSHAHIGFTNAGADREQSWALALGMAAVLFPER